MRLKFKNAVTKFSWLRRFVQHPGNHGATSIFLLAVSFYLIFKELADFRLYLWFDQHFTVSEWNGIKKIAVTILFYACLVQLIKTVFDLIPEELKKEQEPESITECLLSINNEIKQHLACLTIDPSQTCGSFENIHHFTQNITVVISNMADHIQRAFREMKQFKKRDIFISLYDSFGSGSSAGLKYLAHWDPKRDSIRTSQITFTDAKYKKYECVKAIQDAKLNVIKWDCTDYHKPSQRGKIAHYVGMRLANESETLGFLNIEFHNREFFPDEIALKDFVENELIAFKCLLEYQFLKRKFFAMVNSHLPKGAQP